MNSDDAAVKSLVPALNRAFESISFEDAESGAQITGWLSRAVERVAVEEGFEVSPFDRSLPSIPRRRNFRRQDGQPAFFTMVARQPVPDFKLEREGHIVFVEIDRTHKPFSVAKLRTALDEGHGAIWIRWGSEEKVELPRFFPEGIEVIWVRVPEVAAEGPKHRTPRRKPKAIQARNLSIRHVDPDTLMSGMERKQRDRRVEARRERQRGAAQARKGARRRARRRPLGQSRQPEPRSSS